VTIRRFRRSLRALRFTYSLLLCLVLFSLAPTILRSAPQKPGQPYAVIFGTVWGPDNRPIYGVRVKIRRATDKPNKVRWEQYSDHMGEFAQHVPAGEADYILSADPKDLKLSDGTQLRLPEEVKVHIYNDEREDTGLHLTR
jgi:hypothetical protein